MARRSTSALRIGIAAVLRSCWSAPIWCRRAVGGNADRLGSLFAGPLGCCSAAQLRGRALSAQRALLLVLAPLLFYWQVKAPLADFAAAASDPSVNASYYAPLLRELRTLEVGYGARPARIEVVPTAAHWEARWVAAHVMIARGWERQLDSYRNGLFYEEPGRLASALPRVAAEEAISYVALPDAKLDYSGSAEARILERSGAVPHTCSEVWRSAHWRLFAVRDASALAQPPARLTQLGVDSLTLWAPRAGSYTVRVHFTPYWALTRGSGCVARARGDWTRVQARAAPAICTSRSASRSRASSSMGRGAAERIGLALYILAAMLARARVLQARALPRGWLDALRQVSLFLAAYLAYRLVRGLVAGDASAAFAHARDVISLERTLHVFVEPSIQAWASGSQCVLGSRAGCT